jgi:DNA-binding Xre family transcriptional regulator
MVTMTTTPKKLILLGSSAKRLIRAGLPASQVQGRRALVRALSEASPSDLWLAASADAPDELLHEALRLPHRRRSRLGGLLTLHPPRTESIQPLDDLFSPFVWSTSGFRFLPLDELAEVLADERHADLFIGGYADPHTETLTLVRGDLRRLSVPVSIFNSSGMGEKPDPFHLSFADCGNTVQLGDYEVAADAILYEADPDYRRRLLAKKRAEDKTFGACLRRLRMQRGLRQSDFGDVSAKTITRIERGETEAPHGRTLATIAARLGVEPNEILSY